MHYVTQHKGFYSSSLLDRWNSESCVHLLNKLFNNTFNTLIFRPHIIDTVKVIALCTLRSMYVSCCSFNCSLVAFYNCPTDFSLALPDLMTSPQQISLA